MNHPLIGITCATNALDPRAKNPQDRLNRAYSRAVWLCGGVPVILPNVENEAASGALLDRIDGLLLSGGNDIDPVIYGEGTLNDTVEIDAPRDRAELPLIRAALESSMPILAICRGIQSLNVALGGTLYQDLPVQRPSSICHTQSEARQVLTHVVCVEPASRLASITGSAEFAVNSFHHQAIRDVAKGLVVVARAEDEIIEAIEMPGDRFIVGVQWHPEELAEISSEARGLFTGLIEAVSGTLCRSRIDEPKGR